MAKIGVGSLQPGDVVLTSGRAFVSLAIKFGTASSVSHAMLYIGNSDIIHAIDKGVVQQTVATAMKDVSAAKVYRHKTATNRQKGLAVGYARAQIGKKYDYVEVMGAAKPHMVALASRTLATVAAGMKTHNIFWGNRNEFFCSELVVAAYQSAGLRMGGWNPSTYSPGDLADLSNLVHIGNLV